MTITTSNSAPVAAAGARKSAAVGALVLLDGSGSFDPDGDVLSFSWALISRPDASAAAIAGPLTPAQFSRPRPARWLSAQLIVNDGRANSKPATVTITTSNSPPVANAGPDRFDADDGEELTLSGALSKDADGDPLIYRWSLIARPSGSKVALRGADLLTPSFTPDVEGDYVVQLLVNDGAA